MSQSGFLTREDLVAACAANDGRTESGLSIPSVLTELAIMPDGALHVANKRALRVLLLFEGWSPAELSLMANDVDLRRAGIDSSLEAYLPTFAGLFLEGLTTHARARSAPVLPGHETPQT